MSFPLFVYKGKEHNYSIWKWHSYPNKNKRVKGEDGVSTLHFTRIILCQKYFTWCEASLGNGKPSVAWNTYTSLVLFWKPNLPSPAPWSIIVTMGASIIFQRLVNEDKWQRKPVCRIWIVHKPRSLLLVNSEESKNNASIIAVGKLSLCLILKHSMLLRGNWFSHFLK